MTSQPARPRDVRIEHADGRVTIVELSYRGFDEVDQRDVWQCATPVDQSDRVLVGEWPPRCTIIFDHKAYGL